MDNRTAMLDKRSERCVCKYCGGRLRIKSIAFNEIVDGRSELYCRACGRIEFGVEPEIYAAACYFVSEFDFNCFADLEDSELSKRMNVAKVCEIMSWFGRSLGLLEAGGFVGAARESIDMLMDILQADESIEEC